MIEKLVLNMGINAMKENFLALDDKTKQKEFCKLLDEKIELQQENKQLKEENKELNKVCELYGQSLYNADLTKMKNILTELERALKDHKEIKEKTNIKEYYIEVDEVLDKIQKLKEKYK